MKTDSRKFLEALLKSPAPSGCEQPVMSIFRTYLKDCCTVESDCIGNNFALLKTDNSSGVVMLTAHADEIGFMIRYIDDNGFIYFSSVGGYDPAVLPGQRVIFSKDRIYRGIIGRIPIHLLDEKDRNTPVKMENLYLDMGFKNRKEALKHMEVGDTGVLDTEPVYLENSLLMSRGLDDKICLFIIAEAVNRLSSFKKSLNVSVLAAAAVQEEIGCRGITAAAFSHKPDLAIALDVTHDTDMPGVEKKKHGNAVLGKGPVICRGPILHQTSNSILENIASSRKIPLQSEIAVRYTGTDADHIQNNAGGIPVSLLEIPLRYMHTPGEICSLSDVEQCIELLVQTLVSLKALPDFSI